MALRSCPLRTGQPEAAQFAHQPIGDRRKSQTELIGSHSHVGGEIGKQIQLLLFDAIFGFSTSALELLIQAAFVHVLGRQGANHKPGVGSFAAMLSLANHPSATAPGIQCLIEKLGEYPFGFPTLLV